MKKFLMIIVLCLVCTAPVFGQTTQQTKTVFCEFLGQHIKFFSPDITVSVDYGKNYDRKWQTREEILDENGKTKQFNSMIDAMNYIGERGWKFEQAYVVAINNQNVYHWLLSK